VAESYKASIAPNKYRAFYEHAPELGSAIAAELPLQVPSLKQAEKNWEKRYLAAAVKAFGPSPVAVARKIGLRYETLHRKLKGLI
jgi:DNA-binding NtrC family response regulator